ncbi:cysteine hydrolase family protein [Lentibacillus salinarum]|uniref:Cysteine hydrolase family protein n=1 Tax=Lentibacillus salinarum TaxID=446820 RepID=A0ABW3ZSP7_9BACI
MLKFDIVDMKKVAIMVIDMENDFVRPGSSMFVQMANDMLPNVKKLLDACRKEGATVIYTTHVHGKDRGDMGTMEAIWEPIREQTALVDNTEGIEIYEEIMPKERDLVIKKHRYSAFYNTDLETQLRNRGVETLIITGTVTNMCCEATARDAQHRDYQVIFVSDATGTMDHPGFGTGPMTAGEVQKATLTSLAMCTAEVASSEEVLKKIEATGLKESLP